MFQARNGAGRGGVDESPNSLFRTSQRNAYLVRFDQTNAVYCWKQTAKINLLNLEKAINRAARLCWLRAMVK